MSELGAGIYLAKDFDFEVNNAGDIRTTSGLSEVEKDLAFRSAQELQPILGSPKSPLVKAEIQQIVSTIANDDPRVGQVTELSTDYPNDRRDVVEIDFRLFVTDQDQPLVFSITR